MKPDKTWRIRKRAMGWGARAVVAQKGQFARITILKPDASDMREVELSVSQAEELLSILPAAIAFASTRVQ